MSALKEHAMKELTRVGLFDEDSDYDGELGKGVYKLIETFADQGHSGMSAEMAIELFNKLVRRETL